MLAAVARAQAASPGFTMTETGDASAQQALNNNIGTNFSHAEWTAVPLAIGVLLVVFGALMAAVLPVLLALTAFIGSVGLADLLSHLVGMNSYANSVMLLMGLAVGVDYSLFYLFRERQERAAGRDRVERAAGGGRDIGAFGIGFRPDRDDRDGGHAAVRHGHVQGLGLAAMVVVFVAMLGSVTVLPAMLSLLGDRVELGRIPLPGSRRRAALPGAGGRRTGPWRRGVGLRAAPGTGQAGCCSPLASAALLLGLAAPAMGMHTQTLSLGQLLPWNSSQASAIAADHGRRSRWPGTGRGRRQGRRTSRRRGAAGYRLLRDRGAARRGAAPAGPANRLPGRERGRDRAPLPGNGTGTASVTALTTLRQRLIPQALWPDVRGTEALTDGSWRPRSTTTPHCAPPPSGRSRS